MSYARKGLDGSEVYVYRTTMGADPCEIICHDCLLAPDPAYPCHAEDSLAGMRAHLLDHRLRGHLVPDAAFERLARELGEILDPDQDTPDEQRGDAMRDRAKDGDW